VNVTPAQILEHCPALLSQGDRERYFRDGFVVVENAIGGNWLARLREVVDEKIAQSRDIVVSDAQFDLDPAHCVDAPRIRRLKKAVDQHSDLWAFASEPPMTEIAADLVGPSVKFHSSKLNFKWADGGDEVKWHQDIQAWPHTNFSPVTLGVYLEDTDTEQGPLAVVPGSHRGELFDMYGADDRWHGAVSEADLARARTEQAVELVGPAGTVVAVHCRAVHGSRANHSARSRPLLLYVYSSADAFPLAAPPAPTSHTGDVVRGEPARFAHMEPLDCRMPPQWEKVGYGSIFTAQKSEEL
jgi:ectoine hydroxylase